MGQFSDWLRAVQLDPAAEMDDPAAEVLFGEVVNRVRAALWSWTRPGEFGSATSDDEAMESVRWFLSRARDGTLPPAKATDRDAVVAWVVRAAWSRCWKRWERDQGRPKTRGPSGLPGGGGGAGEPPAAGGMDPASADGRGGSPHFDEGEADALVKEALEGTRADLRRWKGERAVQAFNLHVLRKETLAETARRIGERSNAVVAGLALCGSFCCCRRLGWGPEELRRGFAGQPVDQWLEKLGLLDAGRDQA